MIALIEVNVSYRRHNEGTASGKLHFMAAPWYTTRSYCTASPIRPTVFLSPVNISHASRSSNGHVLPRILLRQDQVAGAPTVCGCRYPGGYEHSGPTQTVKRLYWTAPRRYACTFDALTEDESNNVPFFVSPITRQGVARNATHDTRRIAEYCSF